METEKKLHLVKDLYKKFLEGSELLEDRWKSFFDDLDEEAALFLRNGEEKITSKNF